MAVWLRETKGICSMDNTKDRLEQNQKNLLLSYLARGLKMRILTISINGHGILLRLRETNTARLLYLRTRKAPLLITLTKNRSL